MYTAVAIFLVINAIISFYLAFQIKRQNEKITSNSKEINSLYTQDWNDFILPTAYNAAINRVSTTSEIPGSPELKYLRDFSLFIAEMPDMRLKEVIQFLKQNKNKANIQKGLDTFFGLVLLWESHIAAKMNQTYNGFPTAATTTLEGTSDQTAQFYSGSQARNFEEILNEQTNKAKQTEKVGLSGNFLLDFIFINCLPIFNIFALFGYEEKKLKGYEFSSVNSSHWQRSNYWDERAKSKLPVPALVNACKHFVKDLEVVKQEQPFSPYPFPFGKLTEFDAFSLDELFIPNDEESTYYQIANIVMNLADYMKVTGVISRYSEEERKSMILSYKDKNYNNQPDDFVDVQSLAIKHANNSRAGKYK
jgi:hypothetical protein